jgi:reverse gyrase
MSTSPQVAEVTANANEAAEASRKDFNFLAMLVSPEEFVFLFPPFYIALFSLLTTFNKRVQRFAIGIPRGFAKTTYIKLLCIWYILFSAKKFILIIGASEKLAVNTLADICDMLGGRNILTLFGNWEAQIEEDTKEQKVFYFRGRHIILKAIGAGTSIRGINRKSSRPDVMIMDDVQRREDAENKELSDDGQVQLRLHLHLRGQHVSAELHLGEAPEQPRLD